MKEEKISNEIEKTQVLTNKIFNPELKETLSIFRDKKVGVVLDTGYVLWGKITAISNYGLIVIDRNEKPHYISFTKVREITDTYRGD